MQAVQWVHAVPSGWPVHLQTSTVAAGSEASGPLPAWALPLQRGGRRLPRVAIGLALAAGVLAATGLQLQVSRWRGEGEALQREMTRQFSAQYPEITEVLDPVLQARRALAAPVQTAPLPRIQQQVALALQAVPELAGRVRGMDYTPGALELELDADAQALADDAQHLERWQQAAQAQGLQLVRQGGGRLRLSTGGSR